MNNINLIEKYMQNAVDTVFAQDSKTRILENGSKFVDVNFKEAGYVRVMSLLMDGLSDYYRVNHEAVEGSDNYSHYNGAEGRDGYGRGSASATWELFKLDYDRGKQFLIDSMDDEETAGLVIGNLLTEFLRTKVVPEVDEVRFAKMADKCSTTLGNLKVGEAIEENTIVKQFNNAFEWLTEHEVPAEEQVIFVNPSVMTLIRNTTELRRYLSQVDLKDVHLTVDAYEGRPIIEVPSNRFFTDVAVGENGYHAKSTSKVINYMVVSKRAIVPVVKLNKSKIWTPDTVQDFDGYKVNFRLYHDVIIPKNKIAGVYTSVGTTLATTKSGVLDVNIKYISAGQYKLTEYYTNPAGINGTLANSQTQFVLGTAYPSAHAIAVNEQFGKLASETDQYYAILDGHGIAVAASKKIKLPTE